MLPVHIVRAAISIQDLRTDTLSDVHFKSLGISNLIAVFD